jgi:nicotinate-nucleotide pyrophosphorylase (carboxylating)
MYRDSANISITSRLEKQSMHRLTFDNFFSGLARDHLVRAIRDALMEDGPDLTTNAVFPADARLIAVIAAKEDSLLAGLPLVPLVLEETAVLERGEWTWAALAEEGACLRAGSEAAKIQGSARVILRAERVILNFICHLSGIANLVARHVQALEGTGVRLLDTRKTLPGLRYPEKYAVLVGGGCNHRKNLGELLMLKDNHIEAAGGISPAVQRLRAAYGPEIPIEAECRTLEEVREAVSAQVSRIMLDNMKPKMMQEALEFVPRSIEVEISGGVTLDSLAELAHLGGERKADFISVGRLTHSAPAADFSMRIRRA